MAKKRTINKEVRAKKVANALSQFYFLIHGSKGADTPLVYRYSAKRWCKIFRALGFDICPSDIGHYADQDMLFRHVGYFVRASEIEDISESCYVSEYHEYFDKLEHYMFFKNFNGDECRLYLNDLFGILHCLNHGFIEIGIKRQKLSSRGKSSKFYYFRYTNEFCLCREEIKDIVKKTGLVQEK